MNQLMSQKKPGPQSAVEPTDLPPLLSLSQAVAMTGLSEDYIAKLRLAGAIRTYPMMGGTKHRYYRDELLKHVGLK